MPLIEAIYATCALPLFYPPASVDGAHFVDGGVLDTLPIARAAERGADLIIAIDVGAGEVRDSRTRFRRVSSRSTTASLEIIGCARKRQQLQDWNGPALIYVRPNLDAFSTFDFGQTEFFLEEGYHATRAALIKAQLMSGAESA